MFPDRLLRRGCSIRGDEVIPHFLDHGDHPWLRVLLEEALRFTGRPRRELERRFLEPLPCESPPGKRALAAHTLGRLVRYHGPTPVPPREARAALFGAGARFPGRPDLAFRDAAERLKAAPEAIRDSLFADLPGELRVQSLAGDLSPATLALHTNLALAQTILFHASSVRIEILGNARVVIRYAKLRGLICTVPCTSLDRLAVLEISGPLSIFRRTLVYGRALGELIPFLAWCNRFRLVGECNIQGRLTAFRLSSGDPILPGAQTSMFDSKLEERFAREFGRAAPGWDLVREPEPVEAGGTLIFPDFALWPRSAPDNRWYLEIIGFWTAEYLRNKLRRLREARIKNLILCIDHERDCAGDDLPDQAHVIWFRRKIDVKAVLQVMESGARS